MKKNAIFLLLHKIFYTMGSSLVGIFFPLLLMQSFGWTIPQTFLWFGSFYGIIFLLFYPILSFLHRFFSHKTIMIIGNMSEAFFFITLALDIPYTLKISLATIFYAAVRILYWPIYWVKTTQALQDSKKGLFWGKVQGIMAFANISGPLLAGYLLEKGFEKTLIFIAFGTFLVGNSFLFYFQSKEEKILPFRKFLVFVRKTKRTIIQGFICENGIQSSIMYIILPIFIYLQLKSFLDMGLIISIAALSEIIFSHIVGQKIDKKSENKITLLSVWSRFFDIALRTILWWFPTFIAAAGLFIVGSFLGPIFQITYYSRISKLSSESSEFTFFKKEQSINFWIFRQMLGMISRTIVFLGVALSIYIAGEWTLLIWIWIGALSSFGLRRF